MKPPILDKAAALQRIGGDEDLYGEILQLFLEDVPSQLSKLDIAIAHLDRTVVERQAHSIKSASANVGAEALRAACMTAEKAAAGATQDELEILSDQLKKEFDLVVARSK